MTLNLLDVTQLLSAYHCALLALLLAPKRKLAGLTLLCLTFSLHMATNLGVSLGVIGPRLDITSAFGLAYGPLFYLFVRGMADDTSKWTPITLLHLLPAAIIAIWQPEPPVPYFFGLPSIVIYVGLALRELYRHKRSRAAWRSDDLSISLDWVYKALIAFACLASVDMARELLGFAYSPESADLLLAFVIASVTVLFTLMTRAAFEHDRRKGALPSQAFQAATATIDPAEEVYETEFETIALLMETQELWREPRLSLADLARSAGLSTREISRAINLHSGASFADFVNGYRVDALNALMADPVNHRRTIMELAFEVGFNSKSAFNRVYRNVMGKTPTEAFATFKSDSLVRNQD